MPMAIMCPHCEGINALDSARPASKTAVYCGWCGKTFEVKDAVQTVVPQSAWRSIPVPPGQSFEPDMGSAIHDAE